MALPKRVKIGGSFYRGQKLSVSAGNGAYSTSMSFDSIAVLNGVSVIPDKYGAGDTFKLEHVSSGGATVIQALATDIFNVGANAAWQFDFATFEKMNALDELKITYNNAAGVAMNVYMTVEQVN